jgi:peptide/nickel transport system substrate-binding protein
LTVKPKSLAILALVAVIGAAAVLNLRSGTPERRSAGQGPASGGSLVSSIRAEPRTFNRYFANDASSNLASLLTQASLVRINRRTEALEPWLAESWTSDDGVNYTMKLRKGLKFSDGRPFTSADVVFAFDAVRDPKAGSPLADSLLIDGQPLEVSALDESTIQLRFPKPFGAALRVLDNFPILPRHKLEPAVRDGRLRELWGPATPPSEIVGLGPFVLSEHTSGQRLVFARNPNYWRSDADGVQLPYLDRLILDVVPDQNTEILRLESGQSDFLPSEIRPEDYASLKRAADARRLSLLDLGPGLEADFLWFNLRQDTGADGRTWLRQTDLRRAISHAIDRQQFANTVFLGAADPVHGPVTPANKVWYSADAPTYPYDPARARVLLAGIGLRDRDGDGLLEDASGKTARFTLMTQKARTSRERGAAVIQESLRQVGLTVDIVTLEVGALVGAFMSGKYDAIYFGTQASDTDPALNGEFWLSSGGFHVWNPGQSKPATDWEAQIDDLMGKVAGSLEQRDRIKWFAEVQRIYAEHVPALYFAAPRIIIAMSPKVANAAPAILQPQILWNAEVLAAREPAVVSR